MKIYETYHICRTGKTKQYYTLYVSREIINGCFSKESCHFVQNLSHQKDIAIEKVESILKIRKENYKRLDDYSVDIDFYESTKREYCDLKAFGMEWTKSAKGFYIRIDQLQNEEDRQLIWNLWRKDKDILKNAGFKIFAGQNDGEWFFFFKNCSNEEMDEKFTVLNTAKENKIITGKYVGEIKKRITVKCNLISITEKKSYYGITKTMKFENNDNFIISYYTGTKSIPEIGTEIELTGTVFAHKEYDGQRQTQLKRIIF